MENLKSNSLFKQEHTSFMQYFLFSLNIIFISLFYFDLKILKLIIKFDSIKRGKNESENIL
jgi:hypothetical protein